MNRPLGFAVLLASMGFAYETRADGPSKDQCVAANENAQSLRQAGKLRRARAELLVCVSPSCPGVVRDDCAERLNELEKSLPTVVFSATAGGVDLSAVKVTVNGEALADRLDGAAVAFDPGEHTFTFETAGHRPVTKSIVLREGDKTRRETVTFGEAKKLATLSIVAGSSDEIIVDGVARGVGRWSAEVVSGPHDVKVTNTGKKPYHVNVDLVGEGTRTLEVTLEDEKKGLPTWLWITAGIVAAGGLSVGGYFLFRPNEEPGARPLGKMASGTL